MEEINYSEKFRYYFKELILTFSEKKSLFSSKKLERFAVFTTFLILTIAFMVINIKELSVLELIEITGIWLVYGGFNTIVNSREKKH